MPPNRNKSWKSLPPALSSPAAPARPTALAGSVTSRSASVNNSSLIRPIPSGPKIFPACATDDVVANHTMRAPSTIEAGKPLGSGTASEGTTPIRHSRRTPSLVSDSVGTRRGTTRIGTARPSRSTTRSIDSRSWDRRKVTKASRPGSTTRSVPALASSTRSPGRRPASSAGEANTCASTLVVIVSIAGSSGSPVSRRRVRFNRRPSCSRTNAPNEVVGSHVSEPAEAATTRSFARTSVLVASNGAPKVCSTSEKVTDPAGSRPPAKVSATEKNTNAITKCVSGPAAITIARCQAGFS